jgi:hypothetical protein
MSSPQPVRFSHPVGNWPLTRPAVRPPTNAAGTLAELHAQLTATSAQALHRARQAAADFSAYQDDYSRMCVLAASLPADVQRQAAAILTAYARHEVSALESLHSRPL